MELELKHLSELQKLLQNNGQGFAVEYNAKCWRRKFIFHKFMTAKTLL